MRSNPIPCSLIHLDQSLLRQLIMEQSFFEDKTKFDKINVVFSLFYFSDKLSHILWIQLNKKRAEVRIISMAAGCFYIYYG